VDRGLYIRETDSPACSDCNGGPLVNRTRSLAAVLGSHLAVLAVTAVSGSALTAVCLFAADATLASLRIVFERLAAGRPQTGRPPGSDPYNLVDDLHDAAADRRGRVQTPGSMPPVYPRNVPYAVESCVLLYPLLVVAFPVWLAAPPGGLSLLAVPGVAAIAAKHYVIVEARTSAGVYETASPRRIRPNRGVLFAGLLSGTATVTLSAAAGPAAVTATAMAVVAPWLLFDCRQAGFGPRRPATTGDAVDRPLSTPDGPPHATLVHDSHAVRRNAVGSGVVYALSAGLSVLLPVAVLAGATHAYWLVAAMVVVLPVSVVLPATALVRWMAESHVEYRFYDDAVVAYDTLLDTAQWVAPAADVRSVSVADPTPVWRSSLAVLPDDDPVVRIERATGETVVLRRLADPEGFERAYRHGSETAAR
jgi:hypothetical protein